jgi:hypothetical protein
VTAASDREEGSTPAIRPGVIFEEGDGHEDGTRVLVDAVDTTATRAIGAAAPGTISYMYGAKWSGNHPLMLESKGNVCRADGGDTRHGRRHPYKGGRQGRRPG